MVDKLTTSYELDFAENLKVYNDINAVYKKKKGSSYVNKKEFPSSLIERVNLPDDIKEVCKIEYSKLEKEVIKRCTKDQLVIISLNKYVDSMNICIDFTCLVDIFKQNDIRKAFIERNSAYDTPEKCFYHFIYVISFLQDILSADKFVEKYLEKINDYYNKIIQYSSVLKYINARRSQNISISVIVYFFENILSMFSSGTISKHICRPVSSINYFLKTLTQI